MKKKSLLIGAMTICVLFTSCNATALVQKNPEVAQSSLFFQSLVKNQDNYSWNSLNSKMTKKEVLEKEHLEEKDVFDAITSPGLSSSFVRKDSSKMSNYTFEDISPFITDCNAIYLFDKQGYFKRFNYDMYINASINIDYSKPNSVSVKFTNSSLGFEEIKSNIDSFLKKVEENYGVPTNSYGSSESNPRFWENTTQSNDSEYYFEERFASTPESSFILCVDKQFVEDEGLIYHISIDITCPPQ